MSELSLRVKRRRVRLILWVSAAIQMGLGAGWATFFAITGSFHIAYLELGLFVSGVCVAWLTHIRRTRRAFVLLTVVSLLVLILFCLYLDVPDEFTPRTAHLYLLVLTLACLFVLKDEHPLLRWGLCGVLMAAFWVFASTHWSLPSELSVPVSVRRVGVWINAGVAIVGLMALVNIMLIETADANFLEREMEQGMSRQEFFLVYQPQVRADGTPVAAEALLRWRHPRLGLVSPGEFIAQAEKSGLILPLGDWVLDAACRTLQHWATVPAMSGLCLSVNVSAQQFLQEDFVQRVAGALSRHAVPASRLKLELTESMLVHDVDDMARKMSALRALGVGCALDDFGTGFSSLSYLKSLPLDQIKIDQVFVRDVLTDASDAAIARTILQLGESLGFAVVAEGVETQGQCDFLLAHRCVLFQGYLFSPPLAAPEFEMYVARSAAYAV
nr:EAL domain-containing protein [uncultured Rhodoferax sp.]